MIIIQTIGNNINYLLIIVCLKEARHKTKKHKMKKTFILTILTVLAAAFIIFASCKKENEITDNIAANFSKVLKDYESQGNSKNGINVAFPENPFDEQGQMHNDLLERFFKEIYGQIDSSLYFEKFLEMVDIPYTEKDFIAFFEKVGGDYYNKNGYNPTLINSCKLFSQNEKEILNAYFTTMSVFTSANDKITLSKDAEEFVINEQGLSKEEKDLILYSMAIYRYSSYFWGEQPDFQLPCVEAWDALPYRLMEEFDWGYPVCMSHLHQISTSWSAAAFTFRHLLCRY